MIRLEKLRLRAGAFAMHVDDLALRDGEFLVILGPTGSGKTVLLETVAGLRRPEEGRVWFGDRDVTLEAPERRRVGFVYQDYALFPHLTVAGNIGFGLSTRKGRALPGDGAVGPRGSADARVEDLAGTLGISSLLDRYPEGLSGGEKQRVALARALAIKPDVLLLDEPLSALDRQTRESLRSLLKRVHREFGATVMHVTHDLDEALALADRLAVLIDGSVRQTGVPDEVVRFPADSEVAGLFGLTNVFPSEIVGEGEDTVRVVLAGGGPELVAVTPVARPDGDLCVVIRAEEIELLTEGAIPAGHERPAGIAVQNLLEGIVRDIRLQSVHASVEIDVSPVLSAHVLRPEVRRLDLRVGGTVRLYVPPSAIHICADRSPRTPPF
jgi:ABC-type sugar transport system ATPase subunit